MKKLKIKKKIILIFVLVLTVFLDCYLIAKYTSLRDGNTTVRVARWNVTYDVSDNLSNTLNLISGNVTQNYSINVTSYSEVALNYSIILTNVPNGVEVKVDNGSYQSPVNNRIEFSNVGTFSASDINTTVTHTLTFNALLESDVVSNNSVGIDIKFDQIN